ncbi:MAG: hypothetical protein WCT39_04610 [Candidatus Margulisiibacteriota bacterium]
MNAIKEVGSTIFVSPPTPGPAPVTPSSVCRLQQPIDFTSTTDVLDSIDSSFSGMTRPHLALGYIHRSEGNQPSAVALVARDIIPWLAGHNYHDLVLEILPRGEAGSRIAIEIDEFNRTGAIGREMSCFINVFDRTNFEALLVAAHNNGICIHAGGINYSPSALATLRDPSATARIAREIAANSTQAIQALQARGRNSVSLNGLEHNDIGQTRGHAHDPASSFGSTLSRLFPYAEIELVMPRLAEVGNNFTDLPLPQNCAWDQFIPASGIRLLRAERPDPRYGTFLIYYPRI